MLVPEGHVISVYLSTCGAGGNLLGSDEKEINYLVFGIIDAQTKEIKGIKQYLVRPIGGSFGKALSPNTSGSSSDSGIHSLGCESSLISDALLQTSGRLLNDVVDDFDVYLRSLLIDSANQSVCLVTDGQLPLRQCLHPEACAKEVFLPSMYWRFADLKKEYVRWKTGDLSQALVPMSDINKLYNTSQSVIPTTSNTITITEMLSELELNPYLDNDFYIKESRDMISIIQAMLIAGHRFESNEVVNLTLEPGICSIDDEIDGNCIVRARGLPWQSSDQDIAKFFRGLNVAKGGVALCLSPQGRRNGEALIRFVSQEHRDMALKRHKHHIGSRYIEVYRATGEDFLSVAGGASNEAQQFLSKGAQVIIRMRGLPYDCTPQQVLDFFSNGENSCEVLGGNEGILFVKKPDGRSTGDAFVLFSQESDAPKVLSKHRESIGQRYIELFRSTIAEVQQVLNRSMDPKTHEPPKPPLISQIPPTISQIPMIPQHVITSGTEKNCIRLRGLPYEAKVEHILHFLEDFAKHIVYQGVHLVYNAQGQFNGEAFIQMDSEQAALASAQQKHNKHMIFGKKQRYIEVFQCSGEDMNMVLNGYQTPQAAISKPPLLSSGMLTTRPPPPQSLQISIPPPLTLSLPHHNQTTATVPTQNPSPALIAQQQAQYIAQQNLIARQQAAAAQQYQAAAQAQLQAASMAQSDQFLQNFGYLANPLMPPSNTASLAGNSYNIPMGQPQFFYIPRPMLPMSLMSGLSPFSAGAGGPSTLTAPPPTMPGTTTLTSPQISSGQTIVPVSSAAAYVTPSVKRSYDNAFRNDQVNISAAKRAYHNAPTTNIYGNTLIPLFGPPTPPVPAPISPRGHHPPTAIFPQPIFYWGYPNSPMSPTTPAYYGPMQIPPHSYGYPPNIVDSRTATLLTVDGSHHQSPVTSPTKNYPMNALPEPVKLAKSFNYIFDDGAHVRNIQMDEKMVHSTPVGEPQLLHSATTTTVTTKKIISIQHNSPQILSPPTMSPNGAFMPEPPPNQMNPNFTQKTIRHSYSPNRSQHKLIDKQYFYPLNINTQTHHIYHHVLPSHAPHTLQ